MKYAQAQEKKYNVKDICNPFQDVPEKSYFENFGVNKTNIDECSPGCIDLYYNDLQFFSGETSRPRERLFFSNYTHLANKLYPLPINLRTVYRPWMGLRSIAGDSRNQATNFTMCPKFWNVFKIEAAIYPIDDNFNMCKEESFYRQSDFDSIDCAYTARIGYFFVGMGAVSIVVMYVVWFIIILLKRSSVFKPEAKSDMFDYNKFTNKGGRFAKVGKSIKNSFTMVAFLLTPYPLPKLSVTQALLKNSILFLIAPISEAIDVVLDGIYIVRLARVMNRFWIEARIIKGVLQFILRVIFRISNITNFQHTEFSKKVMKK